MFGISAAAFGVLAIAVGVFAAFTGEEAFALPAFVAGIISAVHGIAWIMEEWQ